VTVLVGFVAVERGRRVLRPEGLHTQAKIAAARAVAPRGRRPAAPGGVRTRGSGRRSRRPSGVPRRESQGSEPFMYVSTFLLRAASLGLPYFDLQHPLHFLMEPVITESRCALQASSNLLEIPVFKVSPKQRTISRLSGIAPSAPKPRYISCGETTGQPRLARWRGGWTNDTAPAPQPFPPAPDST